MCRPPLGTADETVHVLRNRDGTITNKFLWRNNMWNTIGTGYGTKPHMMSVLGWRYGEAVQNDSSK